MPSREPFERYREIVDDWASFREVIATPLPTTIWVNRLRTEPVRLRELLSAEGVPTDPLSWRPGGFRLPLGTKPGKLWPVLAGYYHIQEEVSMVPIALLEPRREERFLDLCAAPGNKTAEAAVAMENRGTIVANDKSLVRMRAVRHALERLGIVNVSTTIANAANYPGERGSFDRVLADVPCSCEGTCRKNPTVIEESRRGGFRGAIGLQRAILLRALQLCRPGGRVVYSTCTFAPEENEAVVDGALAAFGRERARVVPARIAGLRTRPGLTEWEGTRFAPDLAGAMRIWPHENDTGGFFAALIERLAPDSSSRTAPRPLSSAPLETAATDSTDGPPAPREALRFVSDRFGLPPAAFAGLRIFNASRRGAYALANDHRAPARPAPDARGLFVLRTDMRFPKLTTAGAMLFGRHATRNVLDLVGREFDDFIARRPLSIEEERARRCEAPGWILVRRREAPLGIGFLRPAAEGAGGTLESWFPKGWTWGWS